MAKGLVAPKGQVYVNKAKAKKAQQHLLNKSPELIEKAVKIIEDDLGAEESSKQQRGLRNLRDYLPLMMPKFEDEEVNAKNPDASKALVSLVEHITQRGMGEQFNGLNPQMEIKPAPKKRAAPLWKKEASKIVTPDGE